MANVVKITNNDLRSARLIKYGNLLRLVKRDRVLLLFVLPCLIHKLIFCYLPMVGITLAFRQFDYTSPVLGIGNFTMHYFDMFFSSPDAWPVIRNTVLLNIYGLVFGFPAPIILALLFNEVKHKTFKKVSQTISYMPNFISTVALCGMITLALSTDYGFINRLIVALGGEPVQFLARSEWFRTIYVASGIWQGIGWGSIIYLATIAGIDAQLYEAALIDGAGRLKQVIHITLPGIRNVIIMLLIFSMGSMLSSGTEKVLLLYKPITYSTADVLGTYIYRMGLIAGAGSPSNFSMGTAVGLFNSIVSLILIAITNQVAKKYSEVSIW